jgi:hypothetical protein
LNENCLTYCFKQIAKNESLPNIFVSKNAKTSTLGYNHLKLLTHISKQGVFVQALIMSRASRYWLGGFYVIL